MSTQPFVPWQQHGHVYPGMRGYDERLVLVLPLYVVAVRLTGLEFAAWFVCPFCGLKQRKYVNRVLANQASCKNKACRASFDRLGVAKLWSYSNAAVAYFRRTGTPLPPLHAQWYAENAREVPSVATEHLLPHELEALAAQNTPGEAKHPSVASMPRREREGWVTTLNGARFVFAEETAAWTWLVGRLEKRGYGSGSKKA